MKWLINLIISVIILAGGIQSGYTENWGDEGDIACARATFVQKQHELTCIAEQLNETEFESDANGTIWNIYNNSPMVHLVRHFAHKYCPAVNRAIHCMRLRYNLPIECLSLFQKEENYLRTEILAEIVKMFCADKAQKFFQLLQHNGLMTIYNNDIFFECFFLIEKYPFVDQTVYPYRMNREFCDGIQEAHECYIDYVDMHPNQDLWKIAGEAHTIARNILSCDMIL